MPRAWYLERLWSMPLRQTRRRANLIASAAVPTARALRTYTARRKARGSSVGAPGLSFALSPAVGPLAACRAAIQRWSTTALAVAVERFPTHCAGTHLVYVLAPTEVPIGRAVLHVWMLRNTPPYVKFGTACAGWSQCPGFTYTRLRV
jgi:hypothetical protein